MLISHCQMRISSLNISKSHTNRFSQAHSMSSILSRELNCKKRFSTVIVVAREHTLAIGSVRPTEDRVDNLVDGFSAQTCLFGHNVRLSELLGHVQDECVSKDLQSQSFAVRLIREINLLAGSYALEPRLCPCNA